MSESKYHTHTQATAYDSPWTFGQRVKALLWDYVWAVFCAWTPKPFNGWRLFWLKLFGAQMSGTPFVHQRARIQLPWNLVMHDRACLGDGANAYTLGRIEIRARATIAQEAYLCTGTHDFSTASLPLQTAPIIVGEDCFVGARAFILPGVTLGDRSIVGACSVVSKDVPADQIVAGQPAKMIRMRPKTE